MNAELLTSIAGVEVARAAPRWMACARAVVTYCDRLQVLYDYDMLGLASMGDAGFADDIAEAWHAGVLLFTRHIDRTRFWADVVAKRTTVWERTAQCITGVVLRPPGDPRGCIPVYDFEGLQKAAYAGLDCADDPTDDELQARVLAHLQRNMLSWGDHATAPVFELVRLDKLQDLG